MRGKDYMVDGYTYVVDMDLSKFFDRVNHDRLMSRLADRIKDKRVLKPDTRVPEKWSDDRRCHGTL